MPKKIFFFPLNDKMKEETAIPITLSPDGTADLSKLPLKIREHLMAFGVQDPAHLDVVPYTEGEKFLDALLAFSGSYWRFRSTPDSLD
ncbi:MAG: hypothetical protein ABIB04_04045 [Patescibacteria group bacterium]